MEQKRFEINHEFKTYVDSALLSEVEPIEQGMYVSESSSHLETLVEYPILDAAKSFLEKGIKTVASSANKKDVAEGECYLILDYNSLNESNKKLAETLYGDGISEQQFYEKIKWVKITIPVTKKTTVAEIKEKFQEIVKQFEDQSR
ncbi:MAG: hypothetical protein KBB91_00775 [Candidatus Pacebacteria bacterium]|nr:hypothetical protein [Candidatus Paceibacterota bacterium]MBP9700940.1 hypothetical protein [Candidatus Paceibacterota bacterium]